MELFISHYCSPFLRARDNFKASSTVIPEELLLKILEIFGFGSFCRKHNYLRLKKKKSNWDGALFAFRRQTFYFWFENINTENKCFAK